MCPKKIIEVDGESSKYGYKRKRAQSSKNSLWLIKIFFDKTRWDNLTLKPHQSAESGSFEEAKDDIHSGHKCRLADTHLNRKFLSLVGLSYYLLNIIF